MLTEGLVYIDHGMNHENMSYLSAHSFFRNDAIVYHQDFEICNGKPGDTELNLLDCH